MSTDHSALDLAWLLISAALVMLMQAGFCCLESGFARAKNSINVAIKNFVDFCVASALFWLFGFGLMFGASWSGICGTTEFALGSQSGSWLLAFFMFQLVFCGTSTTIISGAIAERTRFSAYLLISALVSGVFYPVFGHWAWAGADRGVASGWLNSIGFIDFAGSTVVHSLGGWFALAAVLRIGPRIGRFGPQGREMHGHDLPMATLGGFLLWFGWFGFNGGSSLAVNESLPLIFINTNLAAAMGGIIALAISWTSTGKPNVGMLINGALGGLVGITASCHIMEPAAAMIVGGIAGLITVRGTQWLESRQIDDVVGAVPVHAFCGAWGTCAVALLADAEHFGNGLDRWQQLLVQLQGVAACAAWSFGGGWLVLGLVSRWLPLRVDAEDELQGLNVAEHGATIELVELLTEMQHQRLVGDFSRRVKVEPHTEVGQVATEYNRVLEAVCGEMLSREQAVEALRRAEARYRSIFEHAVEGIFQTSPDGRYLAANPALAKIYGYDSPDELMNSIESISTQLYVDPQSRDKFVELMRQTGKVFNFEAEIRRRDGSQIWIAENARAITDEQGSLAYYEGSVIDVTARKQAEEFERQKKAAEAANAAKSEFLANMSHEIRTPLNGVIGMLDLLAGTALSPQQTRYAGIAKSSASALLSVINQILDFSKIEAGKLELERAEFALHALIEETCDQFVARIHEKGLELACLIDSDVPNDVEGDPERLRQVLMNLISNAVKFTERGEVVVRVRRLASESTQATVAIEVRDSGIGIPPDRVSRLFHSFSQVDASTTRRFGGTGLGLAISRRLAVAMGGDLTVESKPGEGSTFRFTLPLGAPQHVAARRPLLPNELRGARVLVVDDNATNREVLATQLAGWQLEPTCTAGAMEAIAALGEAQRRRHPFSMVIMDHQMPELDGLDLAAEIRQRPDHGDLPLLLLTSSGLVLDRAELEQHGLVGCLTKPVRQSRLFDAVVDSLVTRSNLVSELRLDGAAAAPAAARLSAAKILVAEDNEVNQLVVTEILARAGYACQVVENGRLAVDAVTSAEFDLLLMDCQMPEMDGFEATQAIRSLEAAAGGGRSRLPIVALTASAVQGDRERCLGVGMDQYITKPIDPTQLLEVVEALLGEVLGTPSVAHTPEAPAVDSALASPPAAADVAEAAPTKPAETQPVDTSASPLVFDATALHDRCLGDEALVRRVVSRFAEKCPEVLESIEQALAAGNLPGLASAAHVLKGMAANLSAVAVANSAGRLEAAARATDMAACQLHLVLLRKEISRALSAAEQLAGECSSGILSANPGEN
ncbi:MAG: ammonium transporter [Pirellulales bacterium]|nr:ammonium transporter [Pirellulales bacterium]